MKQKPKSLGERLITLREAYALSQADFAAMVEMTVTGISNIENGITKNPYQSTLRTIAERFGTTLEWLAKEEGEMLPNGKKDLDRVNAEGSFNPATDTLYKELREQIMFYRGLLTQMAGGKANFPELSEKTGLLDYTYMLSDKSLRAFV